MSRVKELKRSSPEFYGHLFDIRFVVCADVYLLNGVLYLSDGHCRFNAL